MNEDRGLWEALRQFIRTVSQCTNCEGCKKLAEEAKHLLDVMIE